MKYVRNIKGYSLTTPASSLAETFQMGKGSD